MSTTEPLASTLTAESGGPARCLSCGQFAGDGHTCPIRQRALGAAHELYAATGVRLAQIRESQRDVAAEVGDTGAGPAASAAAENALCRMQASTDHLEDKGQLDPVRARGIRQRIEQTWSSLRAGEALTVQDVALLSRLAESHAPELSPARRLELAQHRLAAAKVGLGLAAIRHRQGGDPLEHAVALSRREEAARAVVRAEADLAASRADRCPSCGQFAAEGHQCPLPAGLPAGDYSSLKGDARTKEMLADLQSAVTAIVASGQLQRWMDAMASNGLNRWSMSNRLTALLQLARRGEGFDRVHLMGFRQWEQHNRHVRKGEKAIWILAPMTRKIRDTDEQGTVTDKVVVSGFKPVPVFNVTQTDGDPLPDLPLAPAPGDATPGTLEGLRRQVGLAGYQYSEEVIPGCRPETGEGTLGFTSQDGRIVVDQRLSAAQKASTIAHELGHVYCGHVEDFDGYRQHRGRMETEAEMTAYMVNRSRGMSRSDADSFTPGYIASWSKGDPAVLTGAMDRAVKAFNKIMEGPWE